MFVSVVVILLKFKDTVQNPFWNITLDSAVIVKRERYLGLIEESFVLLRIYQNLKGFIDVLNSDFELQALNETENSKLDNVLRESTNNRVYKTLVQNHNLTDVWSRDTVFFCPNFSHHCSVTLIINVNKWNF